MRYQGGRLRFEVAPGQFCEGQYVIIDRPVRLVFTWGWTDSGFGLEPGTSRVEVTLARAGSQTVTGTDTADPSVSGTLTVNVIAASAPYSGGNRYPLERKKSAVAPDGATPSASIPITFFAIGS